MLGHRSWAGRGSCCPTSLQGEAGGVSAPKSFASAKCKPFIPPALELFLHCVCQCCSAKATEIGGTPAGWRSCLKSQPPASSALPRALQAGAGSCAWLLPFLTLLLPQPGAAVISEHHLDIPKGERKISALAGFYRSRQWQCLRSVLGAEGPMPRSDHWPDAMEPTYCGGRMA